MPADEMNEGLSACQICATNDWTTVREGRDLCRLTYEKIFRLTQCKRCGHVMQNPEPDSAEIGAAYSIEENYIPYRPAWKQGGWPLWKILRTWTMSRRTRWLKQYGKGNLLLDVGCGSGDFLVSAQKHGWTVRGVEYNEAMVKQIRAELGFDVRNGELATGLWDETQIDAITFWNVLEHVSDALSELTLAAKYLRHGGCVLLQIPNRSAALSGQSFGEYWALLDFPRHLHFYNEKELAHLCGLAGLRLVAFNTPIVQSAWCYFASCWRWSNRDEKKILAKARFLALAAIVMLMMPFIALQALRGRGMETVAIAVKD